MKHDYNYWRDKGDKANDTKEITEKFCANHIKKLKAKNTKVSYGAGNPDIIVCKKNKNFEFYEVKPYMENWEKKGNGWHPASPDRRKLSKPQLKKFREMLKNGLSVYVIYYDRFIYKQKKRKPKLTIHKHKKKLNPREVTHEMLKNLDATDPTDYFGWDQEYQRYHQVS